MKRLLHIAVMVIPLPPYNPTAACYEPHCTCPPNYTREDLDPCDYDDMGDYGEAVVCELNRISNELH